MRLIVIILTFAFSALMPELAFAQSRTLASGLCFTRIPNENNKSTKLYIDGGLKDLGEVSSIKIIAVGPVTVIEAHYSQGRAAYTETLVSQGKRLDMFLGFFKPAEFCPNTDTSASLPAN
jgi:hypothetical protein